MSEQPSPLPHYPDETISMRTYVERLIADLSAMIRQKSDDRANLAAQRWIDHDAVHNSEHAQLEQSFEKATLALHTALDSHRREHMIAETAQDKADATHQTQHKALNELRDVVGDLTARYVPLSSMQSITESWERRWADRQKDFDAYRDGVAKQEAAYREAIRVEIASLREASAKGEGRGVGAAAVVGYAFAAAGFVGAIVGAIVVLTR